MIRALLIAAATAAVAIPTTLPGGSVVDLDGLDRLIASDRPVLIDVGPAPVRPAGMDAGRPWAPIHRTIPGSRWWPGAGAETLPPAQAAHFRTLRDAAADRTIVVFCHPECRASWNAARRLVTLGHPRIVWFPGGIERWQERHPLAVATPDPAYEAPADAIVQ